MSRWLLLDATYLCHRAFHALPDLSFAGEPTAVAFGFFRDLEQLRDRFGPCRFAIFFDRGRPLREWKLPSYKRSRRERREQMSDLELEARRLFREQMDRLAGELLPRVGFRVYAEDGYEADDLIASACGHLPKGDEAIVVGSDGDLLQLISERVRFCKRIKQEWRVLTVDWFRKEYGIEPPMWADVKALAGCTTDDVPGIAGVGEKTAAKFLAGKLKPGSKVYEKIVRRADIWKRNEPIVRLPFEGTPPQRLRPNRVTPARWREVSRELGFESLRERAPLSERRRG